MAAHKPVEWVQAVINRFDEQVCITYEILWKYYRVFDTDRLYYTLQGLAAFVTSPELDTVR